MLADTSVWIDHLRRRDDRLAALLEQNEVLMHPFVLGELACGNLANRSNILGLLGDLPVSRSASNEEVLFFIEQKGLMGQGIGYIDAHVLAATALSAPAILWTRDRALDQVARSLGLAFERA